MAAVTFHALNADLKNTETISLMNVGMGKVAQSNYDHYADEFVDDDECWNCDGDGYVYGCSWDWQCDTWDGDSCLCSRRCHVCNPAKPDPALQSVLADALTTPKDTPNA